MVAAHVAYPVNTKTRHHPVLVFPAPRGTTQINPVHRPAHLAPKVSTVPPQQTQPATLVLLAPTTIKSNQLLPVPANYVLQAVIKMQQAVHPAFYVHLVKI